MHPLCVVTHGFGLDLSLYFIVFTKRLNAILYSLPTRKFSVDQLFIFRFIIGIYDSQSLLFAPNKTALTNMQTKNTINFFINSTLYSDILKCCFMAPSSKSILHCPTPVSRIEDNLLFLQSLFGGNFTKYSSLLGAPPNS